jgi:two-component system cell cycle response regulator DivK
MQGSRPPLQSIGKRILIVEDNELNLRLLQDVLEFNGYTTIVSTLGLTAVDIARRQRPDLILLDIQLPDISGTEVARLLKADDLTRSIPVLAVTAFAMPGDRKQILESGCDQYVSKPVRLTEFLALVKHYLAEKAEFG